MTELKNLRLLDAERSMPLMKLPLRTVVIEMKAGRVLFSPASTMSADDLGRVGEVTDIVAPNLLHLEGIPSAVKAHPKARVWGPKSAQKKAPEIAWNATLGIDPWPYDDELHHLPVEGMPRVKESLFLHRASKALLVTDFAFNMGAPPGLGPRIVLGVFGTYGRFGVSRLFLMMVKDKAAFTRSIAPLVDLDFDHVVPSHGDVVSSEAKPRLLAALRERGYGLG
ncbi:MAG: hypothetical protein JNK04_14885 [Myxococcales bacterium]|nr:hypothetical protein [Myxococcales bacterium]